MPHSSAKKNSRIGRNLFAGVDHISLDNRDFNPSPSDIECICRFFSIGKLKDYQKEKGIIVSHSSFFVFVETSRGQFALKFYSADMARNIAIEYSVNHFLVSRHFPTPMMYARWNKQPFFPSNGRLATCFSYVSGQPAWQKIKQKEIILQINAVMLALKEILMKTGGRIPFQKQENLTTTIATLNQTSKSLSPYTQKNLIRSSLQDAFRTYQSYPSLFTRQWVHNNAGLTNFLVNKKTVYTLDLSHIREDYALSDLASLVISCLFLKVPRKTVKMIANDYLIQHKIGRSYKPALTTLIQIKLLKEYLKYVHREKSADFSTYPKDLVHTYRSHLLARKMSIAAFLQPKALHYLT